MSGSERGMLYKYPNMYLPDTSGVLTSVAPNFVLLYMLGSTSVAEPSDVAKEGLASALQVGSFSETRLTGKEPASGGALGISSSDLFFSGALRKSWNH